MKIKWTIQDQEIGMRALFALRVFSNSNSKDPFFFAPASDVARMIVVAMLQATRMVGAVNIAKNPDNPFKGLPPVPGGLPPWIFEPTAVMPSSLPGMAEFLATPPAEIGTKAAREMAIKEGVDPAYSSILLAIQQIYRESDLVTNPGKKAPDEPGGFNLPEWLPSWEDPSALELPVGDGGLSLIGAGTLVVLGLSAAAMATYFGLDRNEKWLAINKDQMLTKAIANTEIATAAIAAGQKPDVNWGIPSQQAVNSPPFVAAGAAVLGGLVGYAASRVQRVSNPGTRGKRKSSPLKWCVVNKANNKIVTRHRLKSTATKKAAKNPRYAVKECARVRSTKPRKKTAAKKSPARKVTRKAPAKKKTAKRAPAKRAPAKASRSKRKTTARAKPRASKRKTKKQFISSTAYRMQKSARSRGKKLTRASAEKSAAGLWKAGQARRAKARRK